MKMGTSNPTRTRTNQIFEEYQSTVMEPEPNPNLLNNYTSPNRNNYR